jgi:CheY-like chemotaxis protein
VTFELSNIWATVASLFTASLIGFIFTKLVKRGDARAQAEAALIGIGPTIIKEQNVRIDQLSQESDRQRKEIEQQREEFHKVWVRERECQEHLQEVNTRLAVLEGKLDSGEVGGQLGWPRRPSEESVVLVVEDEELYARTLTRTLTGAGLEPFAVTTGHEALRWLRTGQFKVMVLDLFLPDLYGTDVMARARQEGIGVPTIAVTGGMIQGQNGLLNDAKMTEAGFEIVISKSGRTSLVVEHVRRLLTDRKKDDVC